MDYSIDYLLAYALQRDLLAPADTIYARNRLLNLLGLCAYIPSLEPLPARPLEEILADCVAFAVQNGRCEDNAFGKEQFETELMGVLTPPPSVVQKRFQEAYGAPLEKATPEKATPERVTPERVTPERVTPERVTPERVTPERATPERATPEKATDYFYTLSQNSNYIRRNRIALDRRWKTKTDYGMLDITINLSKPEKDPKDIAAARLLPPSGYPACLLCMDNEGYAGRPGHPARQNHRIIRMRIAGENWGLQYSPYVYYNEHCILLSEAHIPMSIDKRTFVKLLDFVKQIPHYFMGSNADLPIVGGSILAHEHFQGGRYSFAMEQAPVEHAFEIAGYEGVCCGIVKWPMSVIRIAHADPDWLAALAAHILDAWRGYSDPNAEILAFSGSTPHNTITPIARKRNGLYELDLVLRNNRTTPDYPLGLFHPHAQLHNIKKENIGLIEVMGLAVLPARLLQEMELLKEALLHGKDIASDARIALHADWANTWRDKQPLSQHTIDAVIQQEIGAAFAMVLAHAGVFKRTPAGKNAFLLFVSQLGSR